MLNGVLQRILDTPIEREPFPHAVVADVWRPDEYAAVIVNRQFGSLSALSAQYPKRDVMWLDCLPAHDWWHTFSQQLLAPSFAARLLAKFAPRYTGEFETEALLICDYPGYAIGPHTDDPRKIVTVLFYLPDDDSQSHLGTVLYRADDGRECKTGEHYSAEGFEPVKKIPYMPNTALVFARTDKSFHGCEVIGPEEKPRWLIAYDVCNWR